MSIYTTKDSEGNVTCMMAGDKTEEMLAGQLWYVKVSGRDTVTKFYVLEIDGYLVKGICSIDGALKTYYIEDIPFKFIQLATNKTNPLAEIIRHAADETACNAELGNGDFSRLSHYDDLIAFANALEEQT